MECPYAFYICSRKFKREFLLRACYRYKSFTAALHTLTEMWKLTFIFRLPAVSLKCSIVQQQALHGRHFVLRRGYGFNFFKFGDPYQPSLDYRTCCKHNSCKWNHYLVTTYPVSYYHQRTLAYFQLATF